MEPYRTGPRETQRSPRAERSLGAAGGIPVNRLQGNRFEHQRNNQYNSVKAPLRLSKKWQWLSKK
jgi:hypothetical protein